MKTVTELIQWLNTPNHIKCTLVDIEEVSDKNDIKSAFNLSSTVYLNDSNTIYYPIISGGLSFSESLSVDGSISASFGSLEITNDGGAYDSYLTYVWKRRPIKVYLGDPSWIKSDFVLIFDGLIEDLTCNSENTLTISIFDKLQKLNDNITETTLASKTEYSQSTNNSANSAILPLLFGECFNISPLLVDNGYSGNTGSVYMYHNGTSNGTIEVRDTGIPTEVKEITTKGTFSLYTYVRGTVTCSAQGNSAGGYTNTVPEIIKNIVKNYVADYNKFTDSDISFSSFTNTSKVGIYIRDRTNILDVCSQLAKSVNAGLICPSITVNDNGTIEPSKLRLVELKNPTGTPKYYFTDASMVQGTLAITQSFPVKPVIKLAYCKNYTVQTSVAEGLNPAINFSNEYLYVTKESATSKTLYKDTGTIEEEQTLLLVTSEANTEAQKRLDLWSKQRVLVTATYFPESIFVQLGDIVNISSTRYNLSNNGDGTLGIVYSINRDWLTGMVEIGVLV
jgi:hypothetical protein